MMTSMSYVCRLVFLVGIVTGITMDNERVDAQQLAVSPGTIATIAGIPGSTTAGNAKYSGPATGNSLYASSNGPQKVTLDAAGNLYFADRMNNVIRKLTPVTAPGSAGNLYGATTTYVMSTIAGTGGTATLTLPACTGGPTANNAATGIVSANYGDGCAATAAILSNPFSVALDNPVDPTMLFIEDLSHYSVRVVNLKSSGNVTYAGGGSAANVVIPAGAIATIAGVGASGLPSDPGIGASDHIVSAHSVAVTATGDILIADTSGSTIRRLTNTAGNNFATLIGGDTNSAGVIGEGTACITKTNAYTAAPCGDGNAAGPGGAGAASLVQLNLPEYAMADAAGNIYIADSTDFRIRVVNMQSTAITLFGVTIQPGTIETIAGTGVDAFGGDGGYATPTAAHPGITPRISNPGQMVLDTAGALYFADTINSGMAAVRRKPNCLVRWV
jgi:hypothetical protein